ncbi:BON domain-containing protein [Aquisalimonas sp.]|uniref:BON domain-containing protein n=1 Tax=Aquisalimonas sp. TaxID=1872621 RepID=UPI0025BD7BC6|nr:BON domain-containing protein [Aquisalimonas sp.]
MCHWKRLCMRFACALLLVGVAAGCAAPSGDGEARLEYQLDARSFSERLHDQRIRSRIMAEILSDDELRHESNITVTVFEGIALLTGEVPNRELGRRIAELAREESGARRVYNELVVASLSSVFARSRDSMISATARTRLLALDTPETLDRNRFVLLTERRRIYLMGRVTPEEAQAITEEVRRVGGVREVVRMFEYVQ